MRLFLYFFPPFSPFLAVFKKHRFLWLFALGAFHLRVSDKKRNQILLFFDWIRIPFDVPI